MAEYIEREKMLEDLRLQFCKGCNNYSEVKCKSCSVDDVIGFVEDLPTADFVEVKHGRWEEVQGQCFRCSECHRGAVVDIFNRFVLTKHCHNCGAKMDLKEGADNG